MDDMKDLLDALESGDPYAINKASLGRIWHHSQEAGHKEFAVLSAERAGMSPAESHEAWRKLKHHVRSQGYGHVKMRGHWTDTDTGHVGSERTLFVPGMKEEHAKKVMHKFKQQAVIHGTHEHVNLHEPSGAKTDIGKFHPGKLAENYSKVRGRPFTFKGGIEKANGVFYFEYVPQTWSEAIAAHRKGKD